MCNSIPGRTLIDVEVLGTRLRGTYHFAGGDAGDGAIAQQAQGRIGVLFVNSLSLPRAASGDSAVYWANAIAEYGYPAIRIDLPGLGDSHGDANTDLLDSINAGGFTQVIAALLEQLVSRFQLSAMVVFGHCAGSVSALQGGAVSMHCKGLILLDPYFHLPQAKRPAARERLSGWARNNPLGRMASNGYDRLRKIALTARGSSLPGNANLPLLACWKQVASAGLPILMLKAPGIKAQGNKPRVGEFDYVDYVLKLAGRKNRISVEFVEDADHSFANRKGREAVERHIASWLANHFPLAHSALRAKAASTATSLTKEERGTSTVLEKASADRYCAAESR